MYTYILTHKHTYIWVCLCVFTYTLSISYYFSGGARGAMVIVAGYRHGDTSSNPGRDWLHFT